MTVKIINAEKEKWVNNMSNVQIYNSDCMVEMAKMKDKEFDLAIVDPPYNDNFIKFDYATGRKEENYAKGSKACIKYRHVSKHMSNLPDKNYFNELFRISANQIVFGGNYFIDFLRNTSCVIVWDKDNTGNFSDAEIAWTSFKTTTRIFKYRWNGMLQQDMKNKEIRIHPTQKPVALYQWLLKNYAKQGDRILDTHLGSGSSAIAADIMGFDFTGYEIDKYYYEAALDRFNRHKIQQVINFEG